MKRKEELNEDLLVRLKESQEQLKLEQKLLYNANQKNEKLEIEISNLETVNQNLNKFLEHDRTSKWFDFIFLKKIDRFKESNGSWTYNFWREDG